MHEALAALVEKHALTPDVATDLAALVSALVGDEGGADPEPTRVAGRYEDLGPIGEGGMGEVRRMLDTKLDRTVAMKRVHAGMVHRPASMARFLEEARATAQLQHPAIVPVHDLGQMPDGRLWFTMKEVRGRRLSEVLAELHATPSAHPPVVGEGWTFARVIAAFHKICQAVAYAHERGVVHRDLKPDNVMVGAHGQVYVLDWGIAKIVGQVERLEELGGRDPVRSGRTSTAELVTQVGQVIGTPAYMAPEQARGEVDRIDARSDVYALGAILYKILAGRPPYVGSGEAVVGLVASRPPTPLRSLPALDAPTLELGEPVEAAAPPVEMLEDRTLPAALVAACEQAMARDPEDRFPSAGKLADEIQAWLDGAKKREQALAVVEQAGALVPREKALWARSERLRTESRALLSEVETWEPEERKTPGWAKAAEADATADSAARLELTIDQTLQAALQIDPGLPEAHVALAERHQTRHAVAEAARDDVARARAETLLRAHATALPKSHPLRQRVAAYLEGDGVLTLVTDPPGAEVFLYRYETRNRRLVEVFERSLGTTPLHEVPLRMGSYLCVVKHPDAVDVRYPVEITRGGRWDGVRPGESEPHPIWLPPRDLLGPGEMYVPAGWFRAGGDPEVDGLPAARLWCGALVVQRFPVTNQQYIAFLDDLVASGREAEALRHAPRERSGQEGALGALLYGRDAHGRFFLQTDADGDTWHPDWPVMHVDWFGARAYVEWLSARSGRPWRLPCELEWEKAARGVDGRWHPWGDQLDPAWCCMRFSHRGAALPAVVDSFPVDESPYGVRGLGGNVFDWCLDAHDVGDEPVVDGTVVEPPVVPSTGLSETFLVVRGGAWNSVDRYARSAFRFPLRPTSRNPFHGVRGVYRPTPEWLATAARSCR